MIENGWELASAEMFVVLSTATRPLARALHENSPQFAASTHTICSELYARERQQKDVPPMLFCHLRGPSSLTAEDDNWNHLTDADSSGFRGLTSVAIVTVTDIPANFHQNGFAIRMRDGVRIFYDLLDPAPYEPIDSPVV
eukprot:3801887-Prymnesium_polylepis.1